MAARMLGGGVQFCCGALQLHVEEHRVVAEPTLAARRMQDAAGPAAFGDDRLRVIGRAQQHDHRVEVRRALRVGHLPQVIEQLGDVRLRIAMAAGVARGVQARCAAERVHAQARVVAERGQARGLRGMARLQQRVLDEGQPRFVDIAHAEFRLRVQCIAGIGEQLAQLDELAGVAARKHQALRGEIVHRDQSAASASRCAANNCAMPPSARPSNASSSSRRNAWPSAVPCNSMKPPPSFITMFMSVSQSLSSA